MGTRLNRLTQAVLTSTHNLCFEQEYEKYQNFLSENFPFLVVKFSIYLNRLVFVMLFPCHCVLLLLNTSSHLLALSTGRLYMYSTIPLLTH